MRAVEERLRNFPFVLQRGSILYLEVRLSDFSHPAYSIFAAYSLPRSSVSSMPSLCLPLPSYDWMFQLPNMVSQILEVFLVVKVSVVRDNGCKLFEKMVFEGG